jgi:8-oxo-dGTP diphosphatase
MSRVTRDKPNTAGTEDSEGHIEKFSLWPSESFVFVLSIGACFGIFQAFSVSFVMKEVVVGILTRGDQVLACQRRSDSRYALKWEFPGGKIERGETPSQALARELHEELDIRAAIGREFLRQEWIYPDGVADPERDGAFRVLYYYILSFTGTPLNRVFEQIRWVSLPDLQALDLLEGNRKAVAFLIEHGTQTL